MGLAQMSHSLNCILRGLQVTKRVTVKESSGKNYDDSAKSLKLMSHNLQASQITLIYH